MKLLVDEDLASRELLRRLHEHLPGQILVSAPGSADDEVWQNAQREGAAIVTANVVDFVRIADARPNHHGFLVVYGATIGRRTSERPTSQPASLRSPACIPTAWTDSPSWSTLLPCMSDRE